MAMAKKPFKRGIRRRRSRYDMESVKFCAQGLTVAFDEDIGFCDQPVQTQFILVDPDLYNRQPALVTQNMSTPIDTTKGMSFGGLTGDLKWTHDPFADNALDTSFGFIHIWEAIHVQALDEFGFPTYLPRLSDPSLGADRDVDLLWKRTSSIPIWSAGNDCGAGSCQLTSQNQNQHDHVKIKSRRRLTEKQALVYSVCFTRDTLGIWAQSGVDFGHVLVLNGWLRLAVKNIGR